MVIRDVTIEREGTYWLVYIDGTAGLTQARNYREVELMAREYTALVENVPLEDVAIGSITVTGASSSLAQAAAERRRARELETAANEKIRAVAKRLHAAAVPLVDIGAILGVSHQRAHQLVTA